jgi:hypothetical protein
MKSLIARALTAVGLQSPNESIPPDPMLSAEAIAQLLKDIRQASLTYCGPPKLENIAEAVQRVLAENVPGSYLEAGVALGGSAILLGRLKRKNTPLQLYDVFSMIPAPGDRDGEDAHRRYAEIHSGSSPGLGGKTYYGYIDNLMEQVIKNLVDFGLNLSANSIELNPGLFENTLKPTGSIALAHIDCDWYDSVRICIDRIIPWLSPGGIMIFDDYSSYSGCRTAVDEMLNANPNLQVIFHKRSLGVQRAPK